MDESSVEQEDGSSTSQALSSKGKRRVVQADPYGGTRCLVTTAADALEFCHCVAKHFRKKETIVCVYKIHCYLF